MSSSHSGTPSVGRNRAVRADSVRIAAVAVSVVASAVVAVAVASEKENPMTRI